MRWALLLVAACGSTPLDRPLDAAVVTGDGSHDAAQTFPYITLAAGWKVDVFRDVTPLIPYVDMQFVDGPETYDNSIASPFVLQGAQGNALGIVAGRELALLTASSFALHDYGEHAPNTMPFPDGISSAVWVNDTIMLSSSSANAGDGVFVVAGDWTIAQPFVFNNVRVIVSDPTGTFDAKATPQQYYGDLQGVYRYGSTPNLIVSAVDASSLVVNGTSMLYTNRTSDTATDLYSVASGTHTKTLLASSTSIDIGAGPGASMTGLGWAVIDASRVVEVDPSTTGNLTQVATTTDLNYEWTGVAVPAATHPLGQNFPSLYVTENNRALNQERVLRFTHE